MGNRDLDECQPEGKIFEKDADYYGRMEGGITDVEEAVEEGMSGSGLCIVEKVLGVRIMGVGR